MRKEGALGRAALRGRREDAEPVKGPRKEPGCVRAAGRMAAERLLGSRLRQALGIRGSPDTVRAVPVKWGHRACRHWTDEALGLPVQRGPC